MAGLWPPCSALGLPPCAPRGRLLGQHPFRGHTARHPTQPRSRPPGVPPTSPGSPPPQDHGAPPPPVRDSLRQPWPPGRLLPAVCLSVGRSLRAEDASGSQLPPSPLLAATHAHPSRLLPSCACCRHQGSGASCLCPGVGCPGPSGRGAGREGAGPFPATLAPLAPGPRAPWTVWPLGPGHVQRQPAAPSSLLVLVPPALPGHCPASAPAPCGPGSPCPLQALESGAGAGAPAEVAAGVGRAGGKQGQKGPGQARRAVPGTRAAAQLSATCGGDGPAGPEVGGRHGS